MENQTFINETIEITDPKDIRRRSSYLNDIASKLINLCGMEWNVRNYREMYQMRERVHYIGKFEANQQVLNKNIYFKLETNWELQAKIQVNNKTFYCTWNELLDKLSEIETNLKIDLL